MVVNFEAENVGRGYNYTLYPRVWEINKSKAQALAMISNLQRALKELDEGIIDE